MRKLTKAMAAIAVALAFITMEARASDKWPQEPNGFKGVAFGASAADLQKVIHARCTGTKEIRSCFTREIQPFNWVDLVFRGDHLARVVAEIPSADFDSIRSLFIEKYGPPHTETHEPVQNLMGAQYDNVILRWMGDGINITLKRFGETLTEGAVIFVTPAESAQLNAEAKIEREKTKKSF